MPAEPLTSALGPVGGTLCAAELANLLLLLLPPARGPVGTAPPLANVPVVGGFAVEEEEEEVPCCC